MKSSLSITLTVMLSLACASQEANAQTLRGSIKDAITGEPLVGATVKVVELQTGAVADLDGNYKVDLPRG